MRLFVIEKRFFDFVPRSIFIRDLYFKTLFYLCRSNGSRRQHDMRRVYY